ncbi:MAG: HD domain-containing protein [Melioribacter sp.]|nr:HD domain-containing protein [Melioribacter sp.]
MINQKPLIEIKKDEEFTLFLLVNRCEIKTSKNGSSYLSIELKDKTSTITANLWDNFEDIAKEITYNKIVKINGIMQDFNGQPQIRVKKIRIAKEEDNVSIMDFMPVSSRPVEEMTLEFNNVRNTIQNRYLKELLDKIFTQERLNSFIKAPAGISIHHAYLHGLLEHTLELVKICDLMCTIHPEINRDLLITGAILHDFGKIEELNFESSFDYTDKGRLFGHIVIGALELEKAISTIENFPEGLKNQLIHLILSHQGKYEYASPVIPKTLEAIVLYQADELSAKANAYKYAIEGERNKNGKWTKFIKIAETSLYIPDKNDKYDSNEEGIK